LTALVIGYEVGIRAGLSREGLEYCGGSGIWAPSGINMVKRSDTEEELLILQNIDIVHEIEAERKDYCNIFEFSKTSTDNIQITF